MPGSTLLNVAAGALLGVPLGVPLCVVVSPLSLQPALPRGRSRALKPPRLESCLVARDFRCALRS